MIRTGIALAIISALALTAQGQLTVTMDAADRNLDGDVIEPHIRLTADNTNGDEALTSVRFRPEIHSGILERGWLIQWTDANNPWFGARDQTQWNVTQDDIRYSTGRVSYPDGSFGPHFLCRYQPDHDEYQAPPEGTIGDELDLWNQSYNSFELMGEVPVGMNWDFALKLTGIGGPVELFSIAGGDLETDQGFFHVSDADRSPQSVPEPATMTMIGIGAIALAALRKKNNGI